jgi:hypothetical protein
VKHQPFFHLRQKRLDRIMGPEFTVSIHRAENRVWVTPKQQPKKAPPTTSYDDEDYWPYQ